MRRSMRKDLLVTTVPQKPIRKKRTPKNPSPKCDALRAYFCRLISIAGVDNIDRDEWAAFCFVHIKTLNKWLLGYPPAHDLIYRIARYIAPKADLEVEDVFEKIKAILKDWRTR